MIITLVNTIITYIFLLLGISIALTMKKILGNYKQLYFSKFIVIQFYLKNTRKLMQLTGVYKKTPVTRLIAFWSPCCKIHKCPGYDLIVGKYFKQLPRRSIALLATLYNQMLHPSYLEWKCAVIVMITKLGKPPNWRKILSVRLLPILTKFFERLLPSRIKELTEHNNLDISFDSDLTLQQCYRIVEISSHGLKSKKAYAAVFLEIQQSFDKVWHQRLLHKLKKILPSPLWPSL